MAAAGADCDRFAIRTGRGAIQDVEIREVGGPIVFGEIPGVVAFVGCANYPEGGREVAEMVTEFAKRRFVVCTSGCSAMAAAMHRDEEGLTPYERFSGRFEAGGVVNVGSCVANAHISGAAIKIASIFAKRKLSGNYAEVADYVYNRVGAVGVAWGAMSQKAAAIAAGFWRLGIPVVVGPQGAKYRRMLLGRSDCDEDWTVRDRRTGDEVYVGPVPEHLFIAAETKEEAMAIIAKLAMRPNDTSRGRSIKLSHYIDLYRNCYGRMPDDLHRFVRTTGRPPRDAEGRAPAPARGPGLGRAADPGPDPAPRGGVPMSRVEPFQPAMQGGTSTATPIEKPAVLAALVRRAKRPLLVVGHRALVAGGDGEHAIDLLARAALKAGWPVVATGDTGPALAARGIEPALCISAMNLGQRLADPAWTGVDGAGPHDVVFLAGLSYALEWTLLSGLRHGPAASSRSRSRPGTSRTPRSRSRTWPGRPGGR